MKKLLLLGGLTAISSLSAFAATVNYSTIGSTLCPISTPGCLVASQTIGDVILTFNPVAASSVNAEPTTFGSFGQIVVSCVGGGTACGPQSLSGLSLNINISQLAPTSGTASISAGTIAGTISGTASGVLVSWATPNAVSIGDVTYSVLNNPLGLVPPSVNNGSTSVQAMITATDPPPPPPTGIPEPATYVMMSAALVGLGMFRKRSSK
jgi:hypothetical protein